METNNPTEQKRAWNTPELKTFNKTDFIQAGSMGLSFESGACYKLGS